MPASQRTGVFCAVYLPLSVLRENPLTFFFFGRFGKVRLQWHESALLRFWSAKGPSLTCFCVAVTTFSFTCWVLGSFPLAYVLQEPSPLSSVDCFVYEPKGLPTVRSSRPARFTMTDWGEPFNILGFVGGVVLAGALLPQIYLAHKRGSCQDISYGWQVCRQS